MKKTIKAPQYDSEEEIVIEPQHALLSANGFTCGDTVLCSQSLMVGVIVGVGQLPGTTEEVVWCIFDDMSSDKVIPRKVKELSTF